MFFFLTEFLPKCYALHLVAFEFDRHTIKVYLLTYLLTYLKRKRKLDLYSAPL